MLDLLIERLREEISGERALDSVRALTRFHRVQASPGLDQAAQWVAAECERHGLRVAIEHVNGDGRTRCLGQLMPQGWDCTRAVAALHDGAERRALCDYSDQRLSLILRSAPASGRFPVVAVPAADRRESYADIDVRGRVVLTDRDVHRVHELAVLERGAAGLLSFGRRLVPPVRTAATDPDALAYTSFWWGDRERRGWGFVISPHEAARLSERLASGVKLELEVEIESRAFDTRIPLVSALQRAPARSGAEVVVVSHLCHPQPSANDNASGVAANLEAARALAVLGARSRLPAPRRVVRHLWVPEFTGTYAWFAARSVRGEAPPVAGLNLDMVGEDQAQCGSTFLIEHPPCYSASFAESLVAAVRERAVERWPLFGEGATLPVMKLAEVEYSGGSDHTVFQDPALGVPCPMLIQWPDRFYHSSFDTPDRCDPASLALAARCAAGYAAFLAAAGAREWTWLAGEIARRSRLRLLATLAQPEAARLAEAERLRAERALGSVLERGPLAAVRSSVAAERAALSAFFRREIAARLPASVRGRAADARAGSRRRAPARKPRATNAAARVPVRASGAPLHYQRWLLEGWTELGAERREAWLAAEAAGEALSSFHELAWSLADGRRTLDAIEHLVWLETGRRVPGALKRFFGWTAALGLSGWRGEGRA